MVAMRPVQPKRFPTEGAIGGANGACGPNDRNNVTRPPHDQRRGGYRRGGFRAVYGALDMVQDLL